MTTSHARQEFFEGAIQSFRYPLASLLLTALVLAGCGSSSNPAGGNGGDGTAGENVAESRHLLGAAHQHSAFSDGHPTAIPADYFRQARERGLAFNFSAEHSDFLFLPVVPAVECTLPEPPTLLDCLEDRLSGADRRSLFKWADTLNMARGESTDHFTGVRGFEWTNQRHGHINVYFSQNYTSAVLDGGMVTMDLFWSWFTRPVAALGGADGLASFNHPGREDTFAAFDPGYTWDGLAYIPDAAPRMVGLEVFNRGSARNFLEFFVLALDNGWHVAPVGSEDHHGLDWGALNLAKTSIVTDDLSEAGLKAAMRQRRIYALLDSEAQSLADFACLHFFADDAFMGAELLREAGETVTLRGSAYQRDSNGDCTRQPYQGQLQILTSGGENGAIVADASANAGELVHRVSAGAGRVGPNAQAWYVLRLLRDEDTVVAYSAPVWIGEGTAPR